MTSPRFRYHQIAFALLLLLGIGTSGVTLADSELAIGGYDPLTYFDPTNDQPRLGDAMYSLEHEGAEYRFISSENATRFGMAPEDYAPAFGGADPVRLAGGSTAEADATIYCVIDGGLYLFESKKNRERWLRSFDSLAPAAISAWVDAGNPEPTALLASIHDRNSGKHLTKKGVGAGGYDPVAYFPEGGGKPIKGSKKFEVEYRGVTHRFASAVNRERFLQQPTRYEPAYGGWCAYAIAHEDYTKPNPKRFLIQGDRLLLFYDGIAGDTYKRWHKEGTSKLEAQADVWWGLETGESTGIK